MPRLQDAALVRIVKDALSLDSDGPVFLLLLIVNRKGFGLCVLGDLAPDFTSHEPLLVEVMKLVGNKLQMFFPAEHLAAPS